MCADDTPDFSSKFSSDRFDNMHLLKGSYIYVV